MSERQIVSMALVAKLFDHLNLSFDEAIPVLKNLIHYAERGGGREVAEELFGDQILSPSPKTVQ